MKGVTPATPPKLGQKRVSVGRECESEKHCVLLCRLFCKFAITPTQQKKERVAVWGSSWLLAPHPPAPPHSVTCCGCWHAGVGAAGSRGRLTHVHGVHGRALHRAGRAEGAREARRAGRLVQHAPCCRHGLELERETTFRALVRHQGAPRDRGVWLARAWA